METTTRTAEDGVAVVDGILKEETLTRLRDFVLGSTVFTRVCAGCGRVWATGLAVASYKVASNYDKLSRVLGDTALRQAWATPTREMGILAGSV